MSAPVRRQHQPPTTRRPDPLRTGISVSSDGGRLQAVVDLHGELDPVSVPQLRHELEQLVDDGIADVTVDLQHLSFCTSQGLDLLDEVHTRLVREHHGALRLRIDGSTQVVRRIVGIVCERDPSFGPRVHA